MNVSLTGNDTSTHTFSRSWAIFIMASNYSILVLCVIGNSLALKIFNSTGVLNSPRHLLLKSLTVCDLIFGLMQVLFSVLSDGTSQLDSTDKVVYMMLTALSAIPVMSSILHLILIGVDRCISIFLPLRYQQIVSKRRVFHLIACSWIYSTLSSCSFLIAFSYKSESLTNIKRFWAIYILVWYIIIALFQLIIFTKISLVVKKQRQAIQTAERHELKTSTVSPFKSSLRLVLFLTTYTVMWAPYILFDFLVDFYLVSITNQHNYLKLRAIFLNMANLNSFVNISVYAVTDSTFYKAAKQLIRGKEELRPS